MLKTNEQLKKILRKEVLEHAGELLEIPIQHITDSAAERSAGGPHDFYSEGDYWHPNPDTPDRLPYIRRDGESNTNYFSAHRVAMRDTMLIAAQLAAAYKASGEQRFAQRAIQHLQEFFLDEATRMAPNMNFAQAIPGICQGRGIGLIDTLHLVEIGNIVAAVESSDAMTDEIVNGLKVWFREFLNWMLTHEYGIKEMNEHNNHSTAWFVQAAAFASFVGDKECLAFCRKQYRTLLLPNQMHKDGSFPHELARTKPYAYSAFNLNLMCMICELASGEGENLWDFALPDGRCLKKGIEFFYPYVVDKSSWPYAIDIQHFDQFPVRSEALFFGALHFKNNSFLDTWLALILNTENEEMLRNTILKAYYLWL